MEQNERSRHLRPCCLKDLAALYEVRPRTIKVWLNKHQLAIGEKVGRYYTIKQMEIIIDKLGEPKSWAA